MADRTQFNLNEQLASWRQRLLQQEPLSSQDADELESHLTETIADLQRRGLSEEEGFWLACRRLGDEETLGKEYAKVHRNTVWLRRITWMLLGVFILKIGMGVATSAGWLVVAAAANWLPQPTFLGLLGIAVRIGLFVLLLGGLGLFLWSQDRGLLGWARRYPLWLGLGLGIVSLLATAAPQAGTVLLARAISVETFGGIMLTNSIGSMVFSGVLAFTIGLGLGVLLWLSRPSRAG
jgi:hypothetical protein